MSARTLRWQAGAYGDAIRARVQALTDAGFAAKLLAHDDALWSNEPAHRAVAANRLGWLDTTRTVAAAVAELPAFRAELVAEGFTHAVLLGMGGSSLAPEVFRRTFGVAAGALDLTVLDNTSPAAVRAVAESHDLTRTLFVVASKSGGTIEVRSFESYFWERVRAVRGDTAGRAFIAITDAGTSLGALAAERGYRRTFTNPGDIGGRYSALSLFGLLPAALIGADAAALLAGAAPELAALAAGTSDAVALGAALGELAREGRDKLTLVHSRSLASLGVWVEQLVAESTGKSGRGIVPIAGERLGTPAEYGRDRVFVALGAPALEPETERALDALAVAGHPVFRWSSPSLADLGADLLRWEIATAVAGAVMGVDPFDEPNVSEAKAATEAVLGRSLAEGHFPERTAAATADGLAAFVPADARAPGDTPADWLAHEFDVCRAGDYFAVLAYLHATPQREAALETLRDAARARRGLATTLGWGPRFLHSTGQLHKGGANNGVFLQLTADEGDVPIPGRPYGFAVLRAAQAAGDFDVLERRGRRVLRIHLGADPDAALARLVSALPAVATS